jgi:hypothetical protein
MARGPFDVRFPGMGIPGVLAQSPPAGAIAVCPRVGDWHRSDDRAPFCSSRGSAADLEVSDDRRRGAAAAWPPDMRWSDSRTHDPGEQADEELRSGCGRPLSAICGNSVHPAPRDRPRREAISS